MVFPPHFKEIDVMAKRVRDSIRTHQRVMTSHLNTDPMLLSTPPSLIAMNYKKMKAYGNHFKVDDE
jgi:hypothetical protein